MQSSGLLLFEAYEKYEEHIRPTFEPDSDFGSLEHLLSRLNGLVEVLNEMPNLSKYRMNVFLDLIFNGSPEEQKLYLETVKGLDITTEAWKNENHRKMFDQRVVDAVGPDYLVKLISDGLHNSEQNAVAALSRTAVINTVPGHHLVSLFERALSTHPEDAAKVLMAQADKVVGKVGEAVSGELLFGNPSARLKPETGQNLWNKFVSAAKRTPQQPHHLALQYTAG